jgi:hypothetical protein
VGLLALIVCLTAAAPAQRTWRRVDSPNFVIVGDAGEHELLNVAIRFEGFREALGRLLPVQVITSAAPTVVIVFPHDRSFAPYKPLADGRPLDVAGVFASGRDINHIAIVNDDRPDRLRIVFHEYGHLMLSNQGREVPAWLGEGLAEFYSTLELGRGGREVVLGRPIESYLDVLNEQPLVSLDQLITVSTDSALYKEGRLRPVFYAQAWALTHMIMLGTPNRGDQLDAYVERLARGVPAMDAWQQTFGEDDVLGQLRRYIRSQAFEGYRFTFTDELASFDAPVTSISPAEAAAVLAGFLMTQERFDEAERHLADAERLDPDNASLTVARARLDVERGRHEDGGRRLANLPTPGDWLTAYLAGSAVAELVERRERASDPWHAEAGARLFGAARDGHAEFPNALARLASLDVRSPAGPTAETRARIERARRRAPGRHDYRLIHAQVLGRLLQFDAARSVLGPLLSGRFPAQIRDSARQLMEKIVALQDEAGLAVRASSPTSPAVAVPFREVQAGESRLEGVLERIECRGGGWVAFHVRQHDATVIATAPDVDDIRVISHRDDVRGTIACGWLVMPLAAYVTWRPAAGDPSARTAVAVEILPKR